MVCLKIHVDGLYYLHRGGTLRSHNMREDEKGQTFHEEPPLGTANFASFLGLVSPVVLQGDMDEET